MEPLSAAVEEQVPDSPSEETSVQQVTDVKEDEEPMEQEESTPVIQDESDPVSQETPKVTAHLLFFVLEQTNCVRTCSFSLPEYMFQHFNWGLNNAKDCKGRSCVIYALLHQHGNIQDAE